MKQSPTDYRLAALLRRQFRILSPATVLLAAIVLLTSLLLALWPRFAASSTTAELRQEVTALSPEVRNAQAISQDWLPRGPQPQGARSTLPGDVAGTYGAFEAAVNQDAASAGPALSALLGPVRFRTTSLPATVTDPPEDVGDLRLSLTVDPFAADHLKIIKGSAPSAVDSSFLERIYQGDEHRVEVPILISRELSEKARWRIGEARVLQGDGPVDPAVVPTGIFEASDPGSDYWAMNPTAITPSLAFEPEHGTTVSAQVLVDPSSSLAPGVLFNGVRTHIWFPLELGGLTAGNAPAVADQLSLFTGGDRSLADSQPTDHFRTVGTARFQSGAPAAIGQVVDRAAASREITTMLVAGPLGIALATLVLAARIVLERRRPTLVLAAARGASAVQLRGRMAVEGLVLGIPAAAAGWGVALAVLPGPVSTAGWALPALIGLSPAAILGLGPVPDGSGAATAGAPPRTARQLRWGLEFAVLAAAALSWWLLARPGNAGTAAAPLLALAPLLLALFVCLLVLRILPFPLAWMVRLRHRGAGLSGFLGPARAHRAPAGGMVPVLALVLGLSMATFSAITLSTLDHGIEATARTQAGADLRLGGALFSPDQVSSVAAVPGVSSTAGLNASRRATLTANDARPTVRVVAADAQQLGRVQAGYPGALAPNALAALASPGTDPLPVIASASLDLSVGDTAELDFAHGITVKVVAVVPSTPGPSPDDQWILADRQPLNRATGIDLGPQSLLVRFDEGADATAGRERILALPGLAGLPSLSATSPQMLSAKLLSSPTTTGLKVSLIVLVLLSSLLCALVVLLLTAGNAPARTRLLGLLRTLGFPASADVKLLLWELGPVLAAAALGGVPLGLLLPRLLSATIDLRPFTRGTAPPPLFHDPLLLATLLGGLLLVVLLSVVAAVLAARRHRTSTLLRIGD